MFGKTIVPLTSFTIFLLILANPVFAATFGFAGTSVIGIQFASIVAGTINTNFKSLKVKIS